MFFLSQRVSCSQGGSISAVAGAGSWCNLSTPYPVCEMEVGMDDGLPHNRPYDVSDLRLIMQKLRDPDTGCPWDVVQDFASIAPYTVEEAYEVADAIDQQDMEQLKGELGDLLLQVYFHAQMAEEAGFFDFEDVVDGISAKMVKRHPHVFARMSVADADAQTKAWEDQKAAERAAKAEAEGRTPSVLDDVARGLPALMRAEKLQKRAARVGFDWPTPAPVIDQVREELAEVVAEIDAGSAPDRLEDELGDLLFTCVNLARKLKIDPETALRRTNAKFERRFQAIESDAHSKSRTLPDMTLAEMEAAWVRAKQSERS
jgi:ATP diphosphatase